MRRKKGAGKEGRKKEGGREEGGLYGNILRDGSADIFPQARDAVIPEAGTKVQYQPVWKDEPVGTQAPKAYTTNLDIFTSAYPPTLPPPFQVLVTQHSFDNFSF